MPRDTDPATVDREHLWFSLPVRCWCGEQHILGQGDEEFPEDDPDYPDRETDPGADDYCRSCGEPVPHEYLVQPGNVCRECAEQEARDEEANRQSLNREYERDVMP